MSLYVDKLNKNKLKLYFKKENGKFILKIENYKSRTIFNKKKNIFLRILKKNCFIE